MTSPKQQRRGDIQGMRALAVGLVIAGHAGFSQFPGGFVGVDVFFVLSGFLITGLLVAESDRTGRISIANFYARRARRILPAATVTLLAILGWAALREPFSQFATTAKDSLWSAVFLANVHFANGETDYFADTVLSPVRHFWSLSVEEQFYLVWPLVVLALVVLKLRRRVLVAVMVAVVVASLIWSVWLTNAHPQAAYFSTPARAHELGLGALLALVAPVLGGLSNRLRHVLAWAGLGAIAFAALVFNEDTAFPSWHALVPVLGTVALLAAGTGREVGLSRLLGRQPLRYLGDLSFSLYLWHWPVLVFGRPHVESMGLAGTVVLLAVTLALSVLSYHFVEQPFQRGSIRWLTARRYLVLWPASLATVAAMVLGASAYGNHQQRQTEASSRAFYEDVPNSMMRLDPQQVSQQLHQSITLADLGAPVPANVRKGPEFSSMLSQDGVTCYAEHEDTTTPPCTFGDPDAVRTMVVFGDSHAGSWVPALDRIAERRGYRLVAFIKLGCAPYDVPQRLPEGRRYDECPSFRTWALEQIAEIRPDVLILGHRAMLLVDAETVAEQKKLWRQGVQRTVDQAIDLAPEVRVLGDIPLLPQDPAACLSAVNATMASCVYTPRRADLADDRATRAVVRRSSATWVDTIPLVCADTRCPMVVGRTQTYSDPSHLSQPWSRNVSRELERRLNLP